MPIERDSEIEFHELGTLRSVTRWITQHDEGIAEFLKNARRAYQADRANVAEPHRAAVLLLRDDGSLGRARIGLLDVGGATNEDLRRWSTWQDPDAASRGSTIQEEETQGNGGKAYMYKLFRGQARIFGVREGKVNCKGFEGEPNSLDRGRPGYIPSAEEGNDRRIESWEDELRAALEPYGLVMSGLPPEVVTAIRTRGAFTIVEGVEPVDVSPVWNGLVSAEELVHRVLRHEQSTLAVEQVRLYAIHNGRPLNAGRPLKLEDIPPYPGFETALVYEIPEELPDDNGIQQSTTAEGDKPRGKLTIRTSRDNMEAAWKKLRPRWKVSYRTPYQMIGSKSVGELVPTTPGSQFVFAVVELAALEPDYVNLGRTRPNDGPLVQALDSFVADKIRSVARQIYDLRRHEHTKETLDAIQEENEKLDQWKNRFLPSGGEGDGGGGTGAGSGGGGRGGGGTVEWGETPSYVEFGTTERHFRIGRGVSIHLTPLLTPVVRDAVGRPVAGAELEWVSNDNRIVRFEPEGTDEVKAMAKGITQVRLRVHESSVVSEPIKFEVWAVDHVLLTPRQLQIPVGTRKRILAEVTNDEAGRATDVLLSWSHDADDQLVVRIRPTGWVTGNRLGKTTVSAGVGDPDSGVWARIRAEIEVVPNPDRHRPSEGFPRLLLTGKNIDPATGETRPGDPDGPALWQEPVDVINNVWWLNLDSPEANFALSGRDEQPEIWRMFHASKLAEMVAQVHMQNDFTNRGESETPDLWSRHKLAYENFQIQYGHDMWEKLQEYVLTGGGLDA
jgi:hypothetical protein